MEAGPKVMHRKGDVSLARHAPAGATEADVEQRRQECVLQ